MQPADVSLLFVLGTASARATSVSQLCDAARLVAPYDWQPTAEVIEAAVARAIREALVVLIEEDGGPLPAVETTPLGRKCAATLLCKRIPHSSGGFMRTCMSIKLCFLHLLPDPDRSAEVANLIALYRDAIAFFAGLRRLPRAVGEPALQDLRCELLRLDSELAWLQAMAEWRSLQQAAE